MQSSEPVEQTPIVIVKGEEEENMMTEVKEEDMMIEVKEEDHEMAEVDEEEVDTRIK